MIENIILFICLIIFIVSIIIVNNLKYFKLKKKKQNTLNALFSVFVVMIIVFLIWINYSFLKSFFVFQLVTESNGSQTSSITSPSPLIILPRTSDTSSISSSSLSHSSIVLPQSPLSVSSSSFTNALSTSSVPLDPSTIALSHLPNVLSSSSLFFPQENFPYFNLFPFTSNLTELNRPKISNQKYYDNVLVYIYRFQFINMNLLNQFINTYVITFYLCKNQNNDTQTNFRHMYNNINSLYNNIINSCKDSIKDICTFNPENINIDKIENNIESLLNTIKDKKKQITKEKSILKKIFPIKSLKKEPKALTKIKNKIINDFQNQFYVEKKQIKFIGKWGIKSYVVDYNDLYYNKRMPHVETINKIEKEESYLFEIDPSKHKNPTFSWVEFKLQNYKNISKELWKSIEKGEKTINTISENELKIAHFTVFNQEINEEQLCEGFDLY